MIKSIKWFMTWVLWVIIIGTLFLMLLRTSPQDTVKNQVELARTADTETIIRAEKIAGIEKTNAETELVRLEAEQRRSVGTSVMFTAVCVIAFFGVVLLWIIKPKDYRG